jgi:MFS family permease
MMLQAEDKVGGTNGFKRIFRTLSYRNYRLFFTGQSISLIGTWMQRVAMSWLVYHLTSSEFLLGLVSFLGLIPVFVLSPFAGVLADRFHRLNLLIATQALAMLQALLLAVLVMTGLIRIGHLMVLASILGLINAFDTPIRQAFTAELVEKKEDLGNAIALNSAMFNGARIVGPTLAGLLIALFGEGFCFLLNGISYLAVLTALLRMKIPPAVKMVHKQKLLKGLKEGFFYSFGFAPIKAVLFLLMAVSIMGMPYMVLMPVFAKDILHGGSHTLGFLMGAAGGGALCGAIYLAQRKTVAGLEGVIPLMTGLFSLGLIGFALSRHQWLSLLLLLIAGFGLMVQMASCNTILQTIVDDDKRGRVMSLYVMCVMGTTPIGSLLAGAAASRLGAPETLMIGGGCCLAGALLFMLKLQSIREIIRPIYIEKGVIAEVALGLQAAAQWPKPPAG